MKTIDILILLTVRTGLAEVTFELTLHAILVTSGVSFNINGWSGLKGHQALSMVRYHDLINNV